eukprot:c24971_g1_i1.p1 GENE.c24971_g1_i1~~c24971_g1_i1.p1  ORF type:complete len:350 (-),score=145.26 c24971_g1_i1:23-1072(-)
MGFFVDIEGDSPFKMYYEIHEPINKENAKNINVICVSGYTVEGWIWSSLVEVLIEQGYRVCTFDNRGCGRSDIPWGPYTTSLFASDTMWLMKKALKWNPEKTHIVSISMGGMITLEILASLAEGKFDSIFTADFIPNPPRKFLSASLLVTQSVGWRKFSGLPPLSGFKNATRIWNPFQSRAEKVQANMEITFTPKWLNSQSGKLHPKTQKPLTNRELIIRRGAKHFYSKKEEGFPPGPTLKGAAGQTWAIASHCVSQERLNKISQAHTPILVVAADKDRLVQYSSQKLLLKQLKPFEYLLLENSPHGVNEERSEEVNQAILRLFTHAEDIEKQSKAQKVKITTIIRSKL